MKWKKTYEIDGTPFSLSKEFIALDDENVFPVFRSDYDIEQISGYHKWKAKVYVVVDLDGTVLSKTTPYKPGLNNGFELIGKRAMKRCHRIYKNFKELEKNYLEV